MFFDSTPNFLYPDFKVPGKFKLSKNLFRRVRARDSFNAIYTSATPYTITLGETPDSIAYTQYKDSKWYWTILLLNNITTTDEWPLAQNEMDLVIESKYGSLADKPRYWETSQIKNTDGEIILDSGIIIEIFQNSTQQNKSNYNPDWSYTYLYDPDDQTSERTVTASMNLTKVTNRDYEYQMNELKREIYLPKAKYLNVLEEELKSLLAYDTEYRITNDGFRQSEEV